MISENDKEVKEVKEVKTEEIGNKETNIKKGNKKLNVVIGTLVLLIISLIVMIALGSKKEDTEDKTSSKSKIPTYEYESEILTGDKLETAKNEILEYTSSLRNNSAYIQLKLGENKYKACVYNKNNEIYSEETGENYIRVSLNNGKTFSFDVNNSLITVGPDVDILTFVENAVNALGAVDNVQLYDMKISSDNYESVEIGDSAVSTESNEYTYGHEYRIDLVGDEAVKELYKTAGDEFADDALDTLKESLGDWEPHIIVLCYIDEDISKSYLSTLYVVDDNEYASWVLDGFIEIDDWKLDESWYSYDPSTDTDGSQSQEMIGQLVDDIKTKLDASAEEKGLELITVSEEAVSTETKEAVSTETKE